MGKKNSFFYIKKKYKMYSLKRKNTKKVNVEITACVEIDKRLRGG